LALGDQYGADLIDLMESTKIILDIPAIKEIAKQDEQDNQGSQESQTS